METLARFTAVEKRYGTRAAVDGLSFAIPTGSVTGLLGPNGAGKTTCLRMLLGLARLDGGTIDLLGTSPGRPGFASVLRRVGALIEGPALYERASARDNLRIEAAARGLCPDRAAVDDLLETVGLTERADGRVGAFSLGMRQRLGVALALVGSPRLVVLDEPTNGLDPAGIVEMRAMIARLPARGTTVLVSSHLLAEVQLMCDRAVIIDRGGLIAEGAMAELLGPDGGFRVEVAPDEVTRAIDALERAGAQVDAREEGELTVTGPFEDGSDVSRLLAQAGIYVRALQPRSSSLEEVFLELTNGSSIPSGDLPGSGARPSGAPRTAAASIPPPPPPPPPAGASAQGGR